MTIPYNGYGYGRATRRERKNIARRDSIIARYWHSRLTHEECDGRPYCSAYRGPISAAAADALHAFDYDGHSPRRYYTGHLHAPCSRYGRDGDECAWWAIAAAFIMAEANGEGLDRDSLDAWMGYAVNDSDHLAALVWDGWYAVPPFVRKYIGTRASVRAMVPDSIAAEYAR